MTEAVESADEHAEEAAWTERGRGAVGLSSNIDESTDLSDVSSVSSEDRLPTADGQPTEVDSDEESTGTPALDFSDPDRLIAAIEAILFVVEAPVSVAALATAVECPTIDVEAALARLATVYDDPSRGIELRWIADGVRIYTRPALAAAVEAFLLDGQRTKLSQAALETLAVIAYRQPVSRGRISAIRGVNVDGVVRTLVSRGLIVEEGLDPDSGAGLFRTTSIFLEKMGLQSVSELPSLAPLLPEIDTLETDEL